MDSPPGFALPTSSRVVAHWKEVTKSRKQRSTVLENPVLSVDNAPSRMTRAEWQPVAYVATATPCSSSYPHPPYPKPAPPSAEEENTFPGELQKEGHGTWGPTEEELSLPGCLL